MISTIVSMLRGFLFLFPFVLEVFFGKAPNPYSRNLMVWRRTRTARPWIKHAVIIVALCSFMICIYLTSRVYSLSTDINELKESKVALRNDLAMQTSIATTCTEKSLKENASTKMTFSDIKDYSTSEKNSAVKSELDTKPKPIDKAPKKHESKSPSVGKTTTDAVDAEAQKRLLESLNLHERKD